MCSGYPDMVSIDMAYLRKHLMEHGITIYDFCESIGRAPTWFYKYVNLQGRMNVRTARLIARVLNIDYDDLLLKNDRLRQSPKPQTVPVKAEPIVPPRTEPVATVQSEALYEFLRNIADAIEKLLEQKGA